MSTEVDQRVVEMRFDNKHFESNVATSMSTLDKLKRALNLDGASKGLENINSSANKVNMSGLASSVEVVRAKFSALEVVGVTALANITNSAVNAGKNMVKSLSVDQITSGWNKYGQKTASVQTIMNATGKSIDEVNTYLDRLMWFSDETSYGFTDMTAALGQMTSAGGDIDKLIPLITGVANATAFAGKGASEFSRVMYNLNQSYSKGYLDYADWKSIDLAGVSSKQLKQMIIDVGVAQGKIKEGEITLGSFAQTLKDKWADTSVLEEAFGKFAEMSELAYEMVQSGEVDTASEAYELLSKKYDGVAITAAKAAQEAKTFSEAIDATKDAVSSGWMKTFEIIFGDYAEAKVLWTDLANTLWDVFAAGAEVRNWVLETALNFAEPWQAIEEKLGNVSKAINKVKDAAGTLEHFQDVVSKVWRGDFNNRGDNPDRRDLLKAAGYDARVVQDLVNKGYQYKLTVEDIQASHEKFGLTLTTSAEETEKLTKKLEVLDDKTLKNLGLTEDEIALYKALAKEAKRTGKTIDQIADNMSKNDGRTLLIDSFKNFGSVILDTIQIIKDAIGKVFEIPTAAEMVIKIYNIISALNKFSEKIRLTDKDTGKLTETGKKFLSIFKGIFATIDIFLTILKGPVKLAFNVLKELLRFFGVNILDILAKVGDQMVKFRDTMDNVIDTITKVVVKNVAKWIEKFKETKFFKTVAEWFAEAGDRISNSLGNISNKIDKFSATGLGKALKAIIDFMAAIVKSVAKSKVVAFAIDAIRIAFEKLKSFFTGFKLPEFSIDNFKMFINNFSNLGNNIASSGKGGIAGVIDGIGKTLSGHTSLTKAKTNFQNGVESFFTGFVKFWLKIGDSLKKAFKISQEALKGIVKFIFGTEEVNLPTIMDAIEKFLMILTLFKAIKLMDSFIAPFENITSALDNVANSLKWKAIASAFKAMALALGVLTVCIIVLSSIKDMKKAWQAAGMLAGLLIVMGGVILALGFLSSKIGGFDLKGVLGISLSLLILIGAVSLMVKTLKDFDNLKLNDPLKTFGYLAATLLAMWAGVKLVAAAGKGNFASIAGLLTMVGTLKLILEVITAYDEYDWFGKSKAIEKMVEMLIALSVAVNLATRGVKAGANVKGLAFIILAMVVSIKILLSAIEDIAEMEDAVLLKGGTVITILLGLMTGMMAVANLTSKGTVLEKGQKSVNNFTGFAMALLAVCAAIWFLGKMDVKTLEQGGAAVSKILLLMTGMLAVLGKCCNGLTTGPIIAMIIGFGVLMAEMAIIIKLLNGVSVESKISTLIAIGGLLLVIAATLRILTKNNIPAKEIWKWVGVLAVLGLIVAELALVLYAIKDMNPLSAMGNAVALSTLLLAMSAVLHILSRLDMRKLSNKKLTKLALIFAGMGIILAELAGILYLMRNVGGGDSVGNAIALSTLLIAMSGVLHILSGLDMRKLSTKKMTKLALIFAGMGLILAELAFVLYSIKDMNPLSAVGNAIALSTLLLTLAGVAIILEKFNVKFNAGAVGTIALLGLVLYELVGVLKLAECIDPVAAMPRILALSTLLVVLAGVALALDKLNVKPSNGAVGTIALLGLVLYELVGVLDLAERIDPVAAKPRIIALSALLVALSGVALALDKLNVKFNGGAVGAIALLAAVLGEVAIVLIIANKINPKGAMTRVLALSTLMGVLTLLLIPLSVLGKTASGSYAAIGALAVLGLVVAELALIMILANKIDTNGAMTRVLALSTLMGVLTLLLVPLAIIGAVAVTALAGVGTLAVLMASLLIVVGILYLMEGLQNGVENAKILTTLATVLTLLLIPLTLIGVLAIPAITGVGVLAVLMASLIIVVGILYTMEGLKKAETNVLILTTLLNALTDTLVTVSLLGPLATMGIISLGALLGMIGIMTKFIIAIGALMEYFPSIEKFVDKGLGMLIKLAGGLGEMVIAFAAGLTSGLPEIGQNLTDFANNIKGFLNVINNDISDNTTKKAGNLVKVIAALTGVGIADGFNIIDGLKKLFGGDSSLESFGNKLSDFGKKLSGFISAINKFDSDSSANMNAFATVIKTLNNVCGNNNLDETQIKSIGTNISTFAKSMMSTSATLKEFTDEDVANIERAVNAATLIAKLNDCIPKSGGLVSDIVGENDMGPWATQLPIMAAGIAKFVNTLTQAKIDDSSIELSSKAVEVIKNLAQAAAEIPNTGGLLASMVGDNDMSLWATQLPILGMGICGFITSLTAGGTIGEEQVNIANQAAKIIKSLAKVAAEIPNTGGLLAAFVGNNDMGPWAAQLPKLGEGVRGFADKVGTFNEDKVASIKCAISAIKEVANMSKNYTAVGDGGDFKSFGSGMVTLAGKVVEFANKLKSVKKDEITAGVNKVKQVISLAKTVASTNMKGLETFGTSLKKVATEGVNGFVKAFTKEDNKTKVTKAAKSIMNGFSKAITDKKDDAKKNAKSVAKAVVNALAAKGIITDANTAGKDVVKGFANGIKNNKKLASDAGTALGKAALKAAKKALDERSPSKEMYKIGDFAGQGFVNALYDSVSTAYRAGSDMADSAKSGLSGAIAGIVDLINSDIDAQPTIRPVIDLSDVQAGANSIAGMFDGNRTLSVSAPGIGAISASMSNRQNGNDDIISAINKLAKNNTKSGDTYNFNGFSYSEGSDVADAIQTLVRAAKMEGRT